jgi:hypothetical protein
MVSAHVCDDVRGWNTNPYLELQFFFEYGDFDINITAPAHIVVSSGEVNPTAVYSAVEQNRLAESKISDKTVFIRTEEEVAALANSFLLLKLGIINLKC